MRAGFLQFTPAWGDKEANLGRLRALLSQARADLIVLPELCTTGYQLARHEAERLAEPFPGGATCQTLEAIAREQDLFLVAGVAERAGDLLFNSAVLVGPRGHVATYRKTHLFGREPEAFAPGDTGFRVHEVRGVRVGLMVCFDWAFPEAARTLALAGAQVLAHPSNLVLPYCQQAMPVRCLENGVFAITANRGGTEHRPPAEPLCFSGRSLVAGPRGELLASAADDRDCLTLIDLDTDRAFDKRLTPFNDLLGDRRPALYRLS